MMRESDYIQQIVNYIKKNLAKGYTIDSLRWALINQDYSRTIVEKAIEIANQQLAEQAPKLNEKPLIKVEVYPDPNDFKILKPFKDKLKEFFE